MEDCLFCKIVEGEIPAEKVYEDEKVLGFLDINPHNPGHTLVVPKAHARNLLDIEEEDWLAVMKAVRILSPKIRKTVGADGINIGINNEPAAGQIIFHLHVHIIPRHENDGFKNWEGGEYKDGEAKEVAEKIRKLL